MSLHQVAWLSNQEYLLAPARFESRPPRAREARKQETDICIVKNAMC